ncbi:MAG: SspB family protein [Maricaulaceae bacterium]
MMNYDQMTQLALRSVIRDAIRRVIREDGLPGQHHFYITFLTRYPGVEIDDQLAAKYPDEVTIVLEHQFWDLNAYDNEFEVTLKFGGVPKYLKVPYVAVSRFHDPSVGFALQFDPPAEMEPAAAPTLAHIKPADDGNKTPAKPAKAKAPAKDDASAAKTPEEAGEKVVSLDAFRKK